MKLLKILSACMLAFMIASCDGISGGGKSPAVLESISANIASGKVFLAGQEFAKDKVIVTATYDDGSTKTVPSADWSWEATGGTFDKTNTTVAQTIKITYGGKETELSVTVGEYKKFVVVGVWGQSNAVGYDESLLTEYDVSRNPARIKQVKYADQSIIELDYCAYNEQDMRTVGLNNKSPTDRQAAGETGVRLQHATTKGIHLPLANLMLDVIPEDYGVIIVPAAYGGRAISYFWDNNKTNAFAERIKVALNTHADSKLAGIIWCQGENDSSSMTGDTYKTHFENLISGLATQLESIKNKSVNGKVDDSIWYNYEYVLFYKNKPYGRAILQAQKDVLGTRYTAIRDDHPVNLTMYTSSTKEAHYAQNYYRTHIAPAVFTTMKNAGAFNINK